MPLSPDKKLEVIKDNATKEGDTGSAEVQIAIMHTRILQINNRAWNNEASEKVV